MSRARRIDPRRGGHTRSALLVLALGGSGVWAWATQGPPPGGERGGGAEQARSGGERSSRHDYVAKLAAARTELATNRLVAAYGDWRTERAALDARRAALDALFAIEDRKRRIDAVLAAIAADPTLPESDPLWGHAIEAMAVTWTEYETGLTEARDRMLLESRPRARRLMATSLARAARELATRLPEEQRHAVAADLIDLYFEPDSEAFRSELQPGVQALAGGDVGLLLQLGVDRVRPNDLGVLVRNEAAVSEAMRHLADSDGQRVTAEP